MTAPADYPVTWDDLGGDLPGHDGELMASHPGQPTQREHIARGATAPPRPEDLP